MQLLAAMFDEVLRAARASRSRSSAPPRAIPGAAAVQAFAGKPQIRIAMLHPEGRVSPVQRRQMTTVEADNRAQHRGARHVRRLPGPREGDVRRRAVPPRAAADRGQLDQLGAGGGPVGLLCLGGPAPGRARPRGRVRRADRQFRQRLSPAGSPRRSVCRWPGSSSPPTRTTSWPASSPPAATSAAAVVATTSPSMDIQVASNFERLLLELEGDDADAHACSHAGLRAGRRLHARGRGSPELFAGGSADQAEVAATIAATLRATGELVDPHTAVGLAVGARHQPPAGRPHGHPGDGASGQVPGCGGGGLPASSPGCPPATPT